MKKETKGLLAEMESQGNVVNYTPGALSLKDLERFNTELDKNKSEGPQVFFTSVDNGEYFDAQMSGNKEKIKYYEELFENKHNNNVKALYKRMKKGLSWFGYHIFKKIDKKFKRRHYNTDWYVEDIQVQYGDSEYYELSDLQISLKNGLYTLGEWYSDESGYDQGRYDIVKNVSPFRIFKEIEKVRINPNYK